MCRDLHASLRKSSEKITKLRANDWGVKPDGTSALVWGTGGGLVHIYCFIFEPYRGTCGSTKSHFGEN